MIGLIRKIVSGMFRLPDCRFEDIYIYIYIVDLLTLDDGFKSNICTLCATRPSQRAHESAPQRRQRAQAGALAPEVPSEL